ncbi:hypothetical protein CANINC_004884 [Pichia inconspicua]|uniref:Uncharacterized protein n=1 Tax=Pichia inconspicua TaxID=52247 RepID=A0A4V4NF25_9ASCO|nr:hypothetical protein CANINC_004884 [[Candida] inconspicua]
MPNIPTIRVIIAGDLGTGKTSLTNVLLRSLFLKEFDANIEDIFCKQIVVDDQPYNLEILDTLDNEFRSGDEIIRLMLNYDVLIYTYAINDAKSFNNLYQRYASLPIHEEGNHEKLVYIDGKFMRVPPIILVGTKEDLENERQVAAHSAEKMKTELNFQKFIECSSINNTNVENLLKIVIEIASEYQNSEKDLTHIFLDDDYTEQRHSGSSSAHSHLNSSQKRSSHNLESSTQNFPSIEEVAVSAQSEIPKTVNKKITHKPVHTTTDKKLTDSPTKGCCLVM